MTKSFILATGLLAGTTIGAGIFSLPYVFSKIGIVSGILFLVFFTAVYSAIHYMYAKVVETRPGEHQFFYFARAYLPKFWAQIASGAIFFELLFVLTIYLILAPTFFDLAFGMGGVVALLIFWLAGSIFMFVRLKWLGIAEVAGLLGVAGIIGIIITAANGLPLQISAFESLTPALFFLPFGPLLFSLAARPAIPKVVDEHRLAKKEGNAFSLGKAVLWGTALPGAVYLIFVLGILKLNPTVSPEALDSLTSLSPSLLSLLGIMGLITLWTSYFMIGINVKDILSEDLKVPKFISALVALFAPLIIYFLGVQDFLGVISFTGSIFLGLEGIFVIAMWRKAFPENKWRALAYPLYAVFLVAIGYEISKVL